MKIEKIKVDTYRIPDLISNLEKGDLRIPRFQRDYVWPRAKVVKLLDSIYNEYPIGSFFFWDAPKNYNSFYRNIAELNIPEPDNYSNIKFILDGQQRTASIYVAVKGLKVRTVDYSKICFDLDDEKFFVLRGSKISKKHIPFYKMIDENEKFKIYNNLSDSQKKVFEKCNTIFSTYPLSIVYVRDVELDEAVEIFERINRGGKPLSLFDLVVAGTWSEDFDLKKSIEKDLDNYFKEKGFSNIRPEIVTQALALAIKENCTNSVQLQMETEEIKKAWDKIVDSLKLAVDFLSENLGVKIFEFIPYPAILSLLAYFYYRKDNKALSRKETETINKWFWRVSFSERYSSATLTKMGDDRKLIFDKILEGIDPKMDYSVNIIPDNLKKILMYRKSAVKNAILCILAMNRPRHFENNNFIALDKKILSEFNSPEKHHIFPRAYLKASENKFIPHLLMNFCFIPSELNLKISDKKPSDYFGKFKEANPEFEEALQSHLIPNDENIWENDYEAFISKRAELIFEKIKELIKN